MRRTFWALAIAVTLAIGSVGWGASPAHADGVNNRDSNIRVCMAGFGFYSLTSFGLACAHVNDVTHQFGTPITGGVNYSAYNSHQMWLNTLWNMGLQAW